MTLRIAPSLSLCPSVRWSVSTFEHISYLLLIRELSITSIFKSNIGEIDGKVAVARCGGTYRVSCHAFMMSGLSRQDAVVLRRLRSPHRSYSPYPFISVESTRSTTMFELALDMLFECNHYNVVRQTYFNVSSLHELFDTVNAQNILGFIRDIGLYRLV